MLRSVAFESTAGDNARRKNASHDSRRARLFAFVMRLNERTRLEDRRDFDDVDCSMRADYVTRALSNANDYYKHTTNISF